MKKTLNTILALLVILTIGNTDLSAKVKLPSFFASNMVLQQQSNVGIWGSTNPNTAIKIHTSWNGKEYTVQSDAAGKWRTKI